MIIIITITKFVVEFINSILLDAPDILEKKMEGILTSDELYTCEKSLQYILHQILENISDTLTVKTFINDIIGWNLAQIVIG